MIQFSAQMGGGQSGNAIRPYHQALNTLFYKNELLSGYFKSLEYFSIVFRVSGKIRDFKSEGPEYLKKVRGEKIYTIDLTIPQYRWDGVIESELRYYVASGVRSCFEMLVEKSVKEGEIINREKLFFDFNKGVEKFLALKL